MFENSAWSNMIWILLYSNFLLLNTTVLNADWNGMLTITSATIPRNSVLLYCIFMLYCRIPHCQNDIWVFYESRRQNITISSTHSTYVRSKIKYMQIDHCGLLRATVTGRLLMYAEITHTRCVSYFTSFLTVPLTSGPVC